MQLAVLMFWMAANWGYMGILPGSGGTMKADISINAHIVGSIARPAHPYIKDWGQSSCLSACIRHLQRAQILGKSGLSANEGGFLMKPAASLKVMSWFIVRTEGAIK
jgi:hypothetical protein